MISVIIPAFNCEKTIQQTIQSILTQKTKKKFELIIVDDCSTDNTIKKIKKFNKIKLIQQKKNSGPAKARNLGAKNAEGEIILFTDSDCIAKKNWIEEMLNPFEEPEIAGVQGAYKTKQKALTAKFVQTEIEDRYDLMKKSMQKKNSIDFIGSYSAGYKKKVFLDFNGFNENFPSASGEDPELSYRMEKKGLKLVFNPKAVVYHLHPENFLNYLKIKFWRGYWRILMYKEHKDKIIKDSYTPQTIKFQILLIYALITEISLLAFNSILQFNQIISNSINSALTLMILISVLMFLVSMTPFAIKSAKKNLIHGIISPAFIFFRTLAFCTGLISGIIGTSIKVKK